MERANRSIPRFESDGARHSYLAYPGHKGGQTFLSGSS
jgi:hypothetical protein